MAIAVDEDDVEGVDEAATAATNNYVINDDEMINVENSCLFLTINFIKESQKEVLNSYVDASEMQEELRRVIPQLKITIRSNIKVLKNTR